MSMMEEFRRAQRRLWVAAFIGTVLSIIAAAGLIMLVVWLILYLTGGSLCGLL